MKKKKLAWKRPRMIVLVRSEQAGIVLAICKGTAGSGPEVIFGQCVSKTWGAGREVCSTRPCAFNSAPS